MEDKYKLFFSTEHLEKTFKSKIKKNAAKGIDKMSFKSYSKANREELFQNIFRKLIDNSYQFSPYLELLKVKNRSTQPRLISIPTIRDKIVLAKCKDILHLEFAECINKEQPNSYISKIKKFIKKNENSDFYYLKTDIYKFYDEINRKELHTKIKKRIKDQSFRDLLNRAIATPTVPANYEKKNIENYIVSKGVPQGLPISNVLAQIYLKEFDIAMNSVIDKSTLYLRYIDDILIISKEKCDNYLDKIKENLSKKLKLKINTDKTESSKWTKCINFLGYQISITGTSISKRTIENQINKIAGKITWYKKGYVNRNNRPINLQSDDKAFDRRFIKEVNDIITGSKSQNKNYGWLFYYIEVDDVSVFYQLDSIIRRMLKECKCFNPKSIKKIKKTSKAYFEIKHNPKTEYVNDFDEIKTLKQKEKFLKSIGVLAKDNIYSEEDVISSFEEYKSETLNSIEERFKY